MTDLQNTQLRKLLRNARMVKDNNARIVQTLVAQVDRLTADRDAWRKLVLEHNAIVKDLNRRIKREDELRWPHEYRIAIPPEMEPKP